MDSQTQSSSTLRLRHQAAKTCSIIDTDDDDERNIYSLSTRRNGKEYSVTQDKIGTSLSKRKKVRTRTHEERLVKDDRSLRYLMAIAAMLSILIVGAFIILAYLLLANDPLSQTHFPYLQKYLHTNQSIFSSWHSNNRTNSSKFTVVSVSEDEENQQWEEPSPLPPSPIYTIPNSMGHIGDKSDDYARLRKDWDERYPPNSPERSLSALKEMFAGESNHLSAIYRQMVPPPLESKPGSDTQKDGKEVLNESDNKNWDYDIYNCPDVPPPGYPREYKTIDILEHWPPTQSLPVGKYSHHNTNASRNEDTEDGKTAPPVMAHLGLCVFDYTRDYEKAMRYRSKEVPFVVRNDPRVAETVERWNDETYRRKLFGGLYLSNATADDNLAKEEEEDDDDDETRKKVYHRAERSITSQVLFRHSQKKKKKKSKNAFWIKRSAPKNMDESRNGETPPPMPPPTKLVKMTYGRWCKLARKKEGNLTLDAETGIQHYDPNLSEDKNSYYYYFRLVGCGEKEGCERNATEYLFDEMPFFQPRRSTGSSSSSDPHKTKKEENLYLVQPEKQRGIHCRFGMPGIMAANHYDASRNAIALLGGSRRYIISRPDQCPNLGLYPVGHPSARHSRVDWTTASKDHKNLLESENSVETSSKSDDPSWIEYRRDLSRLVTKATSLEVVLQAGDVLYLPSYWFHFIISLTTNMQCNTRSGRDGKDDQTMADCGFPTRESRARNL